MRLFTRFSSNSKSTTRHCSLDETPVLAISLRKNNIISAGRKGRSPRIKGRHMPNRIAAAAGAVLTVAVVGACTPRPQPPLSSAASVSVNGNDAQIHNVTCSQLEWYRTIDIGGEYSGAAIVIDEHAQPLVAKSVRIKNLGGFTGMHSNDDAGNADVSLSGDSFTITGTANGFKTDKPDEPATAVFKTTATC